MSMRTWGRSLAPPVMMQLYHRWSGRTLRFAGHPQDWEEALRMSSGYAARQILDRVAEATRAVVSGRARFERDSVLLDEPEYPFAVLSVLWRAAALGDGDVDVVDFGGSLGSTYRQCRPLLTGMRRLRWRIVEQPSFVAAGRDEFSTEELRFHESVDELPPPEGVRVVVASGVLQYVEDLHGALEALTRTGAEHFIIDRTPMSAASAHRLCIQHVPKHIYAASYPCRVLSKVCLVDQLERHWTVRCDFACAEGDRQTDDGLKFAFRGLILQRRTLL